MFSSQIFLNIIIIISLAVCAVFVNTTYENYNYNTTELGYIKSLYGKGYVYLYSALPGNDIADNIDRDALTDCKISVVSTVNGYSLRGMTSISAYDGFLLEDLGINLVAGRLPEKNEILEVLAFNNLAAIGDKVTVKVNSNLSVNAVHGNLHLPRAFNFGSGIDGILDAVYFSIITMTTVGYGDIIPSSPGLSSVLNALPAILCSAS